MNKREPSVGKRNILFLEQYGDHIGGGQIILLDILRFFRSQNRWNIFINIPGKGKFSDRLDEEGFSYWNYPSAIHSTKSNFIFDIIRYTISSISISARLIRVVKREKIDLIYCNGGKTFLIGLLISYFSPATVVWHLHLILEHRQKLLVTTLGRLKKVVKIIAVSETVKSYYSKNRVHAKIDVVQNWVSPVFRGNPLVPRDVEKPLPYNIVIIGQISIEKGQYNLLELLEKSPHVLPFEFSFIGTPLETQIDNWKKINQKTADLNHRGWNIQLMGYQKGISNILDRSDFTLISSLVPESFGLVAIESMARGAVVIANRVGALPEIIRHEINGFLVDLTTPTDLLTLLERIEKKRVNLLNIRENAYQTVSRQFQAETQISMLQRLIWRQFQIRILEINGRSDYGGGPKNMHRLLKGISKEDFVFFVACPDEPPFYQKLREIDELTLFPLRLRHISFANFIQLYKIIKRNRIQVVHSQGKAAGVWSRTLRLFFPSVKIIHHFRGIHYKHYSTFLQRLYFWFERVGSLLTDRIIHVSTSEYTEAKSLRLCLKNIQTVIHNGVEPFSIPPLTQKEARRKLGLNNEIPICVVIARYSYQKNLESSFKVIHQLIKKGQTIQFIIVGGADDISQKSMRAYINQLHIENSILLAGVQANVVEWLCAADIYLSTSRWEGLPTAILEAMSVGLPVVCSNVVGNVSVVSNETGLLVDEEDIEGYVTAIMKILGDERLRSKFSESGKELVRQKFSVTRMIESHQEMYGNITRR